MSTHLVIIPSYNTGAKLFETVAQARARWSPVWVVIDGSTDGTGTELARRGAGDPGLRVLIQRRNGGKGAAILAGLRAAQASGFTHALTMDADGQHSAATIPAFMAASQQEPQSLILGLPVFDASAPRLRVEGRRVSNGLANLETLWLGIGDSLCGFRVYPIAELRTVMESSRWMRRFDFDVEAAVRLCWRGLSPVNLPVAIRYFRPDEGGVSHFHYLRDNVLLAGMHGRLLAGFFLRLPQLIARRARSSRH
ncbi:MAG TPA: glycosyltransferase family 2 protein [Stellaceae bacterium]|nr:glycosyltransferase family 2 protein [Stellaceae bacterium]